MSADHGAAATLTTAANKPLEIADIIRAYGPSYIQSRAGQIPACQLRVLQELAACRTIVMGGHASACDQCGHVEYAYL